MIWIRSALPLILTFIAAIPAASQSARKVPPKTLAEGATPSISTGRLSRWLDMQAGTLSARYKDAAVSDAPWIHQFRFQFQARGRIKFDRAGHYYAGFRLGTGNYFSYGWNSTGIGAGDLITNIYLKEFFFSATPRKLFEIQFGGIGINRGESTEITSYSNNGYLMGERIRIRRPDKLFFDEISATAAYVGDIWNPGVIQRIHRLSRVNYHQFLIAKNIRQHISFSADYTFQDGIETLRQAVKLLPGKNRLVDSLLFENYQRLDYRPAWGCAVSIQKNPLQRLALTGGFVNIDRYFVNWNADRLGRGKRIFMTASYNFWREFSAGLFAGKAFSNSFSVSNAARYDLIVAYDFLKALKRADIF